MGGSKTQTRGLGCKRTETETGHWEQNRCRQETRTGVWGLRKGTQPEQDTRASAWRDGDGGSGDLDQHLEIQDTEHQNRDRRNWDRDAEALRPVQGQEVTSTQGTRTETSF